jgi:Helix-turn-helix domain
MRKLHTIDSAAEFLGGISPWTVRRWLTQGRLTRFKVGARTVVDEKELIALVKPETTAQTAERNSKRERMRKQVGAV